MRKKTGSTRFVLSFDSLDQRIAPSGFTAAPTDSAPAQTSPPTSINTPPPTGGGSTPSKP